MCIRDIEEVQRRIDRIAPSTPDSQELEDRLAPHSIPVGSDEHLRRAIRQFESLTPPPSAQELTAFRMAAYAPVATLDLTSHATTPAEAQPRISSPQFRPIRRSNANSSNQAPATIRGTMRVFPAHPQYPRMSPRDQERLGWTVNADESVERPHHFD
ncbi:hypothetical protein JCM5353_001944 [Sporobolomyces roseus]